MNIQEYKRKKREEKEAKAFELWKELQNIHKVAKHPAIRMSHTWVSTAVRKHLAKLGKQE